MKQLAKDWTYNQDVLGSSPVGLCQKIFRGSSNAALCQITLTTCNMAVVPDTAVSGFMKSVVAVESSRVALQQIRGVEGSDYINASFIDVRLA